MTRIEMINMVGTQYLTENIENGEFSYPKAYKQAGLQFTPITDPDTGRVYEKLDIRFIKDGVSVLVETKDDFTLPKNKKAAVRSIYGNGLFEHFRRCVPDCFE